MKRKSREFTADYALSSRIFVSNFIFSFPSGAFTFVSQYNVQGFQLYLERGIKTNVSTSSCPELEVPIILFCFEMF